MVSYRASNNDEVGSGGGSSFNHVRDHCAPKPFPVVRYIEKYGDWLDGARFFMIRLEGDMCEICDIRSGPPQDPTVGP